MPSEQNVDISELAHLAFKQYTQGTKDSFYLGLDYIVNLSIVSWFDFFVTFIAPFFLLYKAITYFKKEAEYQQYVKKDHVD